MSIELNEETFNAEDMSMEGLFEIFSKMSIECPLFAEGVAKIRAGMDSGDVIGQSFPTNKVEETTEIEDMTDMMDDVNVKAKMDLLSNLVETDFCDPKDKKTDDIVEDKPDVESIEESV